MSCSLRALHHLGLCAASLPPLGTVDQAESSIASSHLLLLGSGRSEESAGWSHCRSQAVAPAGWSIKGIEELDAGSWTPEAEQHHGRGRQSRGLTWEHSQPGDHSWRAHREPRGQYDAASPEASGAPSRSSSRAALASSFFFLF